MESLYAVGQNPYLMGLLFGEFGLIMVFTMDGFVTVACDLYGSNWRSLPTAALSTLSCLSERSQGASSIPKWLKETGTAPFRGCSAVWCVPLFRGQGRASGPASPKPSVPACPKSCPSSCLQSICRIFGRSEQSLCLPVGKPKTHRASSQ